MWLYAARTVFVRVDYILLERKEKKGGTTVKRDSRTTAIINKKITPRRRRRQEGDDDTPKLAYYPGTEYLNKPQPSFEMSEGSSKKQKAEK